MKLLLLIVVAAAACKPSKPMVAAEAPAAPAAAPNAAVKYVGNLQADVKLAQEAKEKADAANKKAFDVPKD